jgi:SPP1 gp7 family putative phage head morphogenesis protein
MFKSGYGRKKSKLSRNRRRSGKRKIYKSRTENVFCATGVGGGVDPSCGLGIKDKSRLMPQAVKEVFGVSVSKVSYDHDTTGRVYGEHSRGRATVVNPHLGKGPPRDLNIKAAPGVTTTDHLSYHELVHQVYSNDPDLGKEIATRLSKVHGPFGWAVSIYGSFEGHFENVIELGAVYVHSPQQLKQQAPEMYALAKEWADRSKITSNVFCSTGEGGGIDPSCGKSSGLSPQTVSRVRKSLQSGKVMYRGQRPKIEGREYSSDPGDFGRGVYYSTSAVRAKQYGAISKTIVVLHNPLILTDRQAYDLSDQYKTVRLPESEIEAIAKSTPRGQIHQAIVKRQLDNAQRMRDDLVAKGYDGLVSVRSSGRGELEVVVFQPVANVFCATGAGGGVDPTCGRGGKGSGVTSTPEFKKWFGKSKVVDKDGKPLVVYHGTGTEVTSFSSGGREVANGIYFTDDSKFADYATGYHPGNAQVMPVYLKMENPAYFDYETRTESQAKALDRAKYEGHDGLIVDNWPEIQTPGSRVFVVFEPTQIKSAIGNRGTFDPKDSIITHARKTNGRPNPLKLDPTRTKLQRDRLIKEINRRFSLLQQDVTELLVTLDVFGMREPIEPTGNVFCHTGPGGGKDPTCGRGGRSSKYPVNPQSDVELTKKYLPILSKFLDETYISYEPSDVLTKCDVSKGKCDTVAGELASYLQYKGIKARVIGATGLKPPLPEDAHPDWKAFLGGDRNNQKYLWHAVVQTEDAIIDLTGSQYGAKFAGIRVLKSSAFKKEWRSFKTHPAAYSDIVKVASLTATWNRLDVGLIDRSSVVTNQLSLNFASTQVDITDTDVLSKLKQLQAKLNPADVDKMEDEYHVTVRYGLHDLDPDRVQLLISQHGPIRAELRSVSLFRNSDADVLKVDVDSRDLESVNAHLGIIPNTTTHPDYHPHLTLAYLKPGTGYKYVGLSGLEGVELQFKSITYSSSDREKTDLATFNVFCPTGEGGGKDPSCGKGGSSEMDPKKVTGRMIDDDPTILNDPVVAKQLVRRIVADWSGNDHISAKLRLQMKLLLQHTLSGGVLSEYHPGPITVYRGSIKSGGTSAAAGARSWSKDRQTAEGFGEVLYSRKIRVDEPALDLDLVLGERGKSEYEVVIGEGRIGSRRVSNELTTNTIWRFLTRDQQLNEFTNWLKTQINRRLVQKSAGTTALTDDHWMDYYIRDTYGKGMEKAFDYIKKLSPWTKPEGDFYKGSKQEFLRSSFSRPVSQERVKLLASRALNELQGVTDVMATKMQRTLVDGFVTGKSPREIARDLNKDVSGLGRVRSERIANTEVIRAFNEGALDGYENMGVTELGVQVEWVTSKLGLTAKGNPSPCELCASLEGIVVSIKESRGMLPRHPNCRCTWVPAGVGEDDTEQKKTKASITKSIERSLLAERPGKKKSLEEARKESSWVGSEKKISSRRPKSILD